MVSCVWCGSGESRDTLAYLRHVLSHAEDDSAVVGGLIDDFVRPALLLLCEFVVDTFAAAEVMDRNAAFETVGKLGTVGLFEKIGLAYASETSWINKVEIVEALAEWLPQSQVDTLVGAVADGDSIVRCAAAESLGLVQGEAAAALLRERLSKEPQFDRARVGFLTGLIAVGERQFFEELCQLIMNAPEALTRTAAAQAVARYATFSDKAEVEPILRSCLSRESDRDAISAIAKALVAVLSPGVEAAG